VCDGGTITFDPSVTSITLTTGELAVSKNMTINGPGARDLDLADQLRERFGLDHVLVASTTEDDDAVMRRDLGAVAADLLAEITVPHDVLGLGWARTVLEMAAHLRKVKAALARMEDGSYGTCMHCEEEIGSKRLHAVPWAPFCIRCQEAADRHEFEAAETVEDWLANAA